MNFRVTACVTRHFLGRYSIDQVPAFVLEGDVHGLENAATARQFAREMLAELTGAAEDDVSVDAVVIS